MDTVSDVMYMLNKFGNITNGDMIKAIFSNCEYQRFNVANSVEMYITNKSGEKWLTVFDSIWWDEPYKRGDENE